jgi:hypothetical protein
MTLCSWGLCRLVLVAYSCLSLRSTLLPWLLLGALLVGLRLLWLLTPIL